MSMWIWIYRKCKSDCRWNVSTYTCDNYKYLKIISDDSKNVSTKISHLSINSDDIKSKM